MNMTRPNSTPAFISKAFRPTKAAGYLNPMLKTTLQKEAPETLVSPSRNGFSGDAAFNEAQRKFKKYGNWASIP